MEIFGIYFQIWLGSRGAPQGIGSAYSGLNVIIKKIKQVTFKGGAVKTGLLLEAEILLTICVVEDFNCYL
jgi:hypothetical protein